METKLCRICGKLGQNFVHIFKTEGLREKIETCLPIIVSPHCLLPDTLCRECTENVQNFYAFIKNCLQNIIILEAQYDIRDSCLKSKQRKEKGCYADFTPKKDSRGVQTEDYLDVITGRNSNFKDYSSNFPLITEFLNTTEISKPKPPTCLVEYDVDSDSNTDEGENNGEVVLGQKLDTYRRISNFVDSVLSSRNVLVGKAHYFDDAENDLISEISQRKMLKRKGEMIETSQPKIFKIDTSARRKCRQPQKLDTQLNVVTAEEISFNDIENFSYVDTVEKTDSPVSDSDNQCIQLQTDKLLSSLPQSCLLCDTHFPGPAALAAHVFETHGIDMSEVVSSGSGESFPEKGKKKIPNLVKISDLKRSDSTEDNQLPDQQPEGPPTLLPSFVCTNCPAVFTSKPDLMTHLRVKHAVQAAHTCGICLHQCNTYVDLKTHLQLCAEHHQITSRYFCQVCRYGHDDFKWLENHVLAHDFLLESCRKQSKMFDPADYVDTNESFENGPLSPSSKSLACSECGLNEFESFKEFSAHRRSQHSIFHCDLCNKFYGRNSHLWKHVNRLHKGHPSITCQLCYKTSASKYHLAQHFNKIHLTKAPKKTVDNLTVEKEDFMSQKFQAFDFQSVKQSFMRQELMEEQKTSVSEAEDNSNQQPSDQDEPDMEIKYESPPVDAKYETIEEIVAPKEIDSSHNLYNNIITNYTPPANEGDYKCPKCSKAFHKKVLLKKHKKNCRPKLQKDLLTRCKTCARIFKDRQSLAKHLVNYHSEYVCEICNEKVQSKCEIVSHIRFQHPGCHLFCKVCSNILRSRADMKDHLRDHLDSYVCQFCGDSLPSKIKLKMHILSLHRKILSLSCGICLKLFETQHILRDHVRLIHRDQLAPLTSCPVCGKNYGSKWKTYDHLNKSHGRIFKACKTCLELFDNDAQLQAHCDVTSHGGQGNNMAVNNLRNSLMAHITSAVNEVIANNEEESESGDGNEENSDQSNDEYDNEGEEQKYYASEKVVQEKISLLEKRLLGKKLVEEEPVTKPAVKKPNAKRATETVAPKKEEECEQTNSPGNPLINSSKRTVYVNSNDPSRCEICLKTWPAKKHLWQHYIRCHKSVAATVCGICLQTNDGYASLQTHLRETHPTLLHGQGFGSNFICRICGRYHNASSKLRLHMVIHENFDWALIGEVASSRPAGEENAEKTSSNGFSEYKMQQQEVYEDNDINYESLIEQVECSSQSDSDNDHPQSSVKEDSSSSDEEEEEEEESEEELSENSLQAQMLKNMIREKQGLVAQRESVASSSEDSSSSFSKSDSSEDEEECSEDTQSKFNSDTADSAGPTFAPKPDELDSAVKSISYECEEPADVALEEDYCELQGNCLNETEIESAVGSIL